ncbi:unnamed protein product [Rhizophagus irregularis]|nr:unnamed protein product [Rhizophagus irregularis]
MDYKIFSFITYRLKTIPLCEQEDRTPTTSDDVDVYKGCISCDADSFLYYNSFFLYPTITKQQQMNVLEEIFCVNHIG